jgi:guanylate kinase
MPDQGFPRARLSTHARRGLCLVVAAPSGCGKSTVAARLLADDPGLRQSVSVTTRAPRPGETDGVHYFFRTQEEFDSLAASGGMLEHATVFGRSYGIPRAQVEAAMSAGTDLLFVIDWQGHRTLRAKLPGDVVGVFLLPPSREALRHRLRKRGDSESDIEGRMAEARSEAAHWAEFDHAVVNDDLTSTVTAVRAILAAARTAVTRQSALGGVASGL